MTHPPRETPFGSGERPAPDPNDLTPAVMTDSEFEAEAKAEVIRSEGIDAWVFPHAVATLGFTMGARLCVPVMVRREDVERARAALKKTIEDSVDLDWEEMDVGEAPTDVAAAQSRSRHHSGDGEQTMFQHMGLVPKIAFIVTAAVLLIGLIAAIVMVFL